MSLAAELFRNLVKGRATILYPFKDREKVHVPEGLRGKLAYYRERCIGCSMCFRVCPSETVEMIEDARGKRPRFYLDRCTHCQQCEDVCPTKAIELTKQFENLGFNRKEMILE
jgi:formate hydrogenlyase subunit 6/NADH:ubiquinone oxidoreductase subunit I